MDLDGADSHSIQYQNANNSVRVTDEFMQAVIDEARLGAASAHRRRGRADRAGPRPLPPDRPRRLGVRRPGHAVRHDHQHAGTPLRTPVGSTAATPAASTCTSTTPPATWPASTCSRFLTTTTSFDVEGFKAARGGRLHRPGDHGRQRRLPDRADRRDSPGASASSGIGYANLGALLMAQGLPYDSDGGRAWAAAITALMTGHAYATSARTAARMGPFAGYHENAEPMLNVLRMHQAEAAQIDEELVPARAALRRPGGLGRGGRARPSATACATRRPACWPRPAPSAC